MAKVHLDDERIVIIEPLPMNRARWTLHVNGVKKSAGEADTVDEAIAHAKGEAWTDADREIALVAFQLPQVAKALRAILAEVRCKR